jgi:CheY-like chemotaxis protein
MTIREGLLTRDRLSVRHEICPGLFMTASPSTRRVLVADDNEDAAETTADILRLGGYEVVIAYDGKQAVEVARVFEPDVAILDINMPVMDGYEAALEIRRQHASARRLFLVALTGRADPSDEERSRQAGFDRHLTKPAPPTDLCALLDSYFGP